MEDRTQVHDTALDKQAEEAVLDEARVFATDVPKEDRKKVHGTAVGKQAVEADLDEATRVFGTILSGKLTEQGLEEAHRRGEVSSGVRATVRMLQGVHAANSPGLWRSLADEAGGQRHQREEGRWTKRTTPPWTNSSWSSASWWR